MSIADHHPEGLQFLLRPHAQCSGMLCGAVMSAYHTIQVRSAHSRRQKFGVAIMLGSVGRAAYQWLSCNQQRMTLTLWCCRHTLCVRVAV